MEKNNFIETATCVMLVDDDRDFIEMATIGLGMLGFKTESFCNPIKAREAFLADPASYQVVVTDLSMPGISGLELAASVRHKSDTARVLLISGLAETIDEVEVAVLGVERVLTKPVTPKLLANAINFPTTDGI